MTPDDVVNRAKEAGIQLVRFLYCDFAGITRGKAVHVDTLPSRLQAGIGLTRAQMAMNLLDQLVPVEGMAPVGEIRLVPDLDTFTILPWAYGQASLLCWQLDHNHEDWGACPRSYLNDIVANAEKMSIRIEASFEVEFFLAYEEGDRYVPFDHAPVYSSIGMDQNATIMHDIVDALLEQGIPVEQALNEFGPGQQEISVRHTDPLRAADNQIKVRDTVRGVALQHGVLASFAPKPYPNTTGSGCHIHFSFWDNKSGKNILYDKSADRGLSNQGRQVVAGLVEHLPALVALTAPSFNSYHRLQPHTWASAFAAWGFDNREAAVRVASPFWGQEEASFNLELKPVDSSANPYIALGGLIAAALDGLDRKLEPIPPSEADPGFLSQNERRELGIRPLPTDMRTALDLFADDEVLTSTMTELMFDGYVAVKRAEYEEFLHADDQFEHHNYFYKF